MPMKDGALNCVAQRVIEHFKKAKRGYGLTSTRKQKIGIWKKRMRQPDARVKDVLLNTLLFKGVKSLYFTYSIVNFTALNLVGITSLHLLTTRVGLLLLKSVRLFLQTTGVA